MALNYGFLTITILPLKKRKNISLGIYPELSLAQARKIRDEYRSLLAQKY